MNAVWLPALLLLLTAPLAFADIGPAPDMPVVIVDVLENGKPSDAPVTLTFVCSAPGAADNPVGQREVNFTCLNSQCRNGNWFYKLSPCFYPENGTFKFMRNGSTSFTAASGSAPFPEANSYRLSLDISTGVLSQEGGQSPTQPAQPAPPAQPTPPCPSAAVLFLPLVALCYHFRRQ
jgi:hypothetical protein